MANEQSRLAFIVGVEGVDRAAADLERFERAVQQAKARSSAGPASSTLSGASSSSKADLDLTKVYQGNAAALQAYERGLSNAGKNTTAQYRALNTVLSDTTKQIETLSRIGSRISFAEVAPKPTGDLFTETQYLRSLGLEGSLARNEQTGKYYGVSRAGQQVTTEFATRGGAAGALRTEELNTLIQRGELAAAELAGLATGTRYLKEQQQERALQQRRNVEADKEQERAARALAAAQREAEAAARRNARLEGGRAASAELPVQRSPFRPPPIEGLSTLYVTDKDGNIIGTRKDLGPSYKDEYGSPQPVTEAALLERQFQQNRATTNLQRTRVQEAVLAIEQDALTRLRSKYGEDYASKTNSGQIGRAYLDALAAARPTLEAQGLFNDVQPALERYAKSATRGAEGYDRMTDHVHALEERSRLQARFVDNRGPLGTSVGGFITDFQQGFRGRRDLPYAEQLGQVAKFSLLYGAAYSALFQLSQGIQAAVQNAIEYNSALRELSIASNSSKEEVSGLAGELGDIASSVGFAPSEGVLSGARGIGIFGAYNDPLAQQSAIAQQFARASSQLAFVTGRTLEQVDQDLGAIAQGFGLDSSGVGYAQDLDAYFAKRFGSTAGGTLETTAQIGSLGAEAGFSIEEVQAFASILQSRTGQTPAATAGFLSQFFGRSGDPALRQKFAELGIDISQPFRDQIEELSALLESNALGDGLKNEIINAFGRGRSGQAAAIITEEFGSVSEAATEARTEAGGAAQAQFEQRLDSVAGQLKQLTGDLLLLGKNIGDSGLLDAFALAVITFDKLVEATNNIVEAFNILPRPVRDLALAAGAVALLLKTQIGRAAIGSVLTRGGSAGLNLATALGFAPGYNMEAGRYTANKVPDRISLSGGLASVGGARAAGAAALAATAGLLTNPVTLAIGGLLAIGELKGQSESLRAAMTEATATLAPTATNDPEQLRVQAEALREQSTRVEASDGLLLNVFTVGDAERSTDAYSAVLQDRADQLERMAKEEQLFLDRLAIYESSPAGDNGISTDIFGTGTVDDIGVGIQTLAATGATATQSFNALTRSLRESADAAETVALQQKLLPGRFFRGFQDSIGGVDLDALKLPETSFLDQAGNAGLQTVEGFWKYATLGAVDKESAQVGNAYSSDELQQALQENLQSSGIEEAFREQIKNGLDPEQVSSFIAEQVSSFDLSYIGGDKQSESEQAALKQRLTDYFTTELLGVIAQYDPNRAFTSAEFTRLLNEYLRPGLDSKLGELQTLGYDEGSTRYTASLRRYLSTLSKINFAGDAPGAYAQERRRVEVLIAQSEITRLEALREVAQSRAESDDQWRRIGRQYLRRELRRAISSRSISLIRQVLTLGNRQTGAIAQSIAENARAEAVLAVEAAQKTVAMYRRTGQIVTYYGRYALEVLAKARNALEKARADIRRINEAINTTLPTQEALTPPEDLEADAEDGPTQAQIDAARALAEAARRGGSIAQATAELQSARADLAAAEEGTVEYYNALQAVYEAQRALAEAIRDDRINKYLLANDITDPVVQARAELIRARSQLRYDQRNNASPELIRADRLEYQQARANLEAQKFQQWFSALQTAESLDRISHAAYIRHLERRKDRLEAIKNRTQQEQDQLDQVDAALKAAKESMSGQFNIGDIKVPTPYEVRRYIEQVAANARSRADQAGTGPRVTPSSQQAAQTTNNNINIDGADTAQIIRILRDILGNNAIKATATKTGKR